MEPPPLRVRRVFDWKRGLFWSGFCLLLFALLLGTWAMEGEVSFLQSRRNRQAFVRRSENAKLFWTVWGTTLGVGVVTGILAFALSATREEPDH